ncbi:MAG: response regulator [Nitrospinae bacterium]|nr:response regulator [Nitrospinota bacterium]
MKNLFSYSIRYFIPGVILLFLALPQVRGFFEYSPYLWFYLFTLSFFISFVSTPFFRWASYRFNVLDVPDPRKVHARPTALLGGAAVYISFAITVIYNFHFSDPLKGIALGSTLIMVSGLADDIWGLSARIRLLAQLLAVSLACYYGVNLTFLPNTAWYFTFFEILVTFIWIIGITNSLNFLDGMDGLAAGLTAIASFYISLVAIQSEQGFVMFLSVALCGSALGFLPFNFRPKRPASIFLGDSGSNFMGFLLGSITVMTGWATNNPVKAYSMPALILAILIFDMTYITIARFSSGKVANFREWVSYVGKDHLHHRLNNLGLSNKQTVLFIYFLALSLGISAIVLKNGRTIDGLLLVGQAFMIFFILVILMRLGAEGAEDVHYKIRSSITSILGFTKLIQEKGAGKISPAREKEFLDIIQSEGENIEKLISDLSDISKFLPHEGHDAKDETGKAEEEKTILGKVLVVDDDEHIRRLAEMSIRKNFQVIFASNGVECLEKMRTEKPDIVLMDIFMPQMNGMDAAKKIKSDVELKDARLIIQTAKKLNPKEIKEALLYADRFLLKPFSPKDLLNNVMEVFHDMYPRKRKC